MAAEERKKYLGIKVETWDKIELASMGVVVATSLRSALDVVGSRGLFGYGKSKTLVKASRFGIKKSTWNELTTLSTVLGVMILLKSGVDLLERKTNILNKEISPGQGLFVYSQIPR